MGFDVPDIIKAANSSDFSRTSGDALLCNCSIGFAYIVITRDWSWLHYRLSSRVLQILELFLVFLFDFKIILRPVSL